MNDNGFHGLNGLCLSLLSAGKKSVQSVESVVYKREIRVSLALFMG